MSFAMKLLLGYLLNLLFMGRKSQYIICIISKENYTSKKLTGICTNVPLFNNGYEYNGTTGTELFFK